MTRNHSAIIQRHIAAMIADIVLPWEFVLIDRTSAIEVTTELEDFTAALKEFVSLIGHKNVWPDITD
jgi:hypothetical protein